MKKGAIPIEYGAVLIILVVVAIVILSGGVGRLIDGFRLIFDKTTEIDDQGRIIPDTYAHCDTGSVVTIEMESPAPSNRNVVFTSDFKSLPISFRAETIVIGFSENLGGLDPDKIVTIYQRSSWLTRPSSEDDWRKATSIRSEISGSRLILTDLPNDHILLDFTAEPLVGQKAICRAQRQVTLEVKK